MSGTAESAFQIPSRFSDTHRIVKVVQHAHPRQQLTKHKIRRGLLVPVNRNAALNNLDEALRELDDSRRFVFLHFGHGSLNFEHQRKRAAPDHLMEKAVRCCLDRGRCRLAEQCAELT